MLDIEKLSPLEKTVLSALETVIDPELGVDIVNLGFIYGLEVDDEGTLKVEMTLTTIGCPLMYVIEENINTAVEDIEGVEKVDLELVWYPAWSPDNMSRYARIALGLGSGFSY